MTSPRKRGLPPEESVSARLAVFAAAAVALVALVVTAGLLVLPRCALGAVALGHWMSWRGRHRRRTWRGQALLGLLLVGCVAYLVADLFLGLFGGALPQAKFALLALAVTSFDLKSRRNLYSHTWHSLAILYVAALFAWDLAFLPWVVGWILCVFLFLAATRDRVQRSVRADLGRLWPWAAGWLVATALVFLLLPRFAGRPLAVPLLISLPLQQETTAELLPSVLPLVGTTPDGTSEGVINLRVRGALGNETVMRVRAPAASYWRAYVLENYQGQFWARVPHPASPLQGVNTNIHLAGEPDTATEVLPQTFYILRPLSVDVPVSYPLRELYFPARQLTLVETGRCTPHTRFVRGSTMPPCRPSETRRLRPCGSRDRFLRKDSAPTWRFRPNSRRG